VSHFEYVAIAFSLVFSFAVMRLIENTGASAAAAAGHAAERRSVGLHERIPGPRGPIETVWYSSRMADPASKLEAKALKLPPEQRARLAERLISSLDQSSDPDSEQLWIREAERRLEELESGRVEAVPAERVIESARSSLR
jgi:putative addiction module component (TIGR02574 family)